MKYFAALLTLLLFGIQACRNAPTGELVNLLDRVVSLNITRNGYTLGKKLTQKQKKTARPVPGGHELAGAGDGI